MPEKCFVCGSPCQSDLSKLKEGIIKTACIRCGTYRVSKWAAAAGKWKDLDEERIATISGYIRANQGLLIAEQRDLDFLKEMPTPTVGAKAEQLLRILAKLYPLPGTEIRIPLVHEDFLRWLTYGSAQNAQELSYLLFDYLRDGVGFVEGSTDQLMPGGIQGAFVKITAHGWEHLQSAETSESSIGFVAMWFDDEMASVWEDAFFPAIYGAGYTPLRIDRKEHNNRIDDEIIATIRGSRFVVADFTGNRAGVYYEAGFAGGLGRPVIWSVRRDWLAKLHFDTRQFNHIVWETDKLGEFRAALGNRIGATLGHGAGR
jgi:hypothetical protein